MTPEQSNKAAELIKELLGERYQYIFRSDHPNNWKCVYCGEYIEDINGVVPSDVVCTKDCLGNRADKFLKELENSE